MIVGMKRKWHDGRDPVPEGVREMAEKMVHAKVNPPPLRAAPWIVDALPTGGFL